MPSSDNYRLVARAALASIDAVLARWLPGGKRQGDEYIVLNPTRSDDRPGSFSINCTTGRWADFATKDKGGDLISLIAYVDDLSQAEACERLGTFLGIATIDLGEARKEAKRDADHAPRPSKPVWVPLSPIPNDAPPPPKAHPRHGKPSQISCYRDAAGEVLCYVYRFDFGRGKSHRKEFAPLTYCVCPEGRYTWRWQALPAPRPLYNLDQLHARPNAPIVICEGEKAADAAAILFPDYVSVTILNGAQSPHKSDWAPLKGREVWLWRDNDATGQGCMDKVAELANKAGAARIEVINPQAFAKVPGRADDGAATLTEGERLPPKWDAADALAMGWTSEHIQLLRAAPGFCSDGVRRPHFAVRDDGIYYIPIPKDGEPEAPYWISSRFEITALTRDARGENWGRLIEFKDRDGQLHVWALPMELLKSDGAEYRGILLHMGLEIASAPSARHLLTQHIQSVCIEERALCTDITGWHDGTAFVLPRRTLTNGAGERVIFQSATNTANTFRSEGTPDEWREHVSTLCAGNSRLVFAVSCALAGPLLHLVGMESGGFHFRGDSSTGKTTVLKFAVSVWGAPDFLQRWRTTDNGLEAIAAQHSDTCLIMDDIIQGDAKVAAEMIYMLANEQGKQRANRLGYGRPRVRWRLLFLSSGEIGLADHVAQAGKKSRAGQEVRLLDLPADAGAGLGVFEELHGHGSRASFSKVLQDAAGTYYGTAGPAFVTRILERPDAVPKCVKELQKQFVCEHVPENASGQVHRAAMRFALVGQAGEIATNFGVTGWSEGAALEAAETCFRAWMESRGGAGNLEEAEMLRQVRRFIELHGEARFSDVERSAELDSHAPKTLQRCGFRRTHKQSGRTDYLVLPETFRSEVCAGFDCRAMQRILAKHDYLRPESATSYTRYERQLPGLGRQRVYVIRLPEEPENQR